MPRPVLRVGEHTPLVFAIEEMDTGNWLAESTRPPGYRAPRKARWKAKCQFQTGRSSKPKRISAIGVSKANARRRLEELIDSYSESIGRTTVRGDTLGFRIAGYISDVEAGLIPSIQAERSKASYRQIANQILLSGSDSQIAEMPVSELTTGDLNREMLRLHHLGHTSKLRHWKAIIRAALNRAVNDGAILFNPAVSLEATPRAKNAKPKVRKNGAARGKRDVLSEEQVQHLLKTASNDWSAPNTGASDILHINAAIGTRISEITSIRWQDLTLSDDTSVIRIVGKLVRKRGSGMMWEDFAKSDLSARSIPLPDETAEIFKRRWAALQDKGRPTTATKTESTYVFASTTGTLPDSDNMTKRLRRIFDLAELKSATNHTLRRTVENRLIRAAVPFVDIELIMGHSQAVAHLSYWDRQSTPFGALQGMVAYPQADS